ncbi:MAG: hypothetical protein ABIJ27_07550, partial [Candidatus Omnitrophota bacterium]
AFLRSVNVNNIVLKVDMILGLPLETFISYFEGLEFFIPLLKGTDHILNIHRLQILPETDLEKRCGSFGIRYSREGSHTVFATGSFPQEEMSHASKLTAVLFRIVNSPLRSSFFREKEARNMSVLKFSEDILESICREEAFKGTKLVSEASVDDVYWNDDIFRDIPTEWILKTINTRVGCRNVKR